MTIKYLKHSEIDKSKWDECILNSVNSLIYVHSFYLDNCTEYGWDALVLDNYEAVMPITFRKKYGIVYLHQPAFLQQGGVFFKTTIDERVVEEFLDEILKRFSFAEINLNYSNQLTELPNIQSKALNNYVLLLNQPYVDIAAKFSSVFLRNLRQAKKHLFIYDKFQTSKVLIDLHVKLYASRFPKVKQKDYRALFTICEALFESNNTILRCACKNGEIYAGIVLLKDEQRIYNIVSSITTKGRKLCANHFLYDSVIKEFSESNLIFDFEGSDIKGIADFYKSMSPLNQKYFSIKFNHLPAFIKLFKK